ncbi:MAG: hypothetical protein A2756_00115 [Candidatus Ryanbacteria bacterium RIFCSPHIGHO2_01_FULL_48_27]|uniref:Uncharacterized protein n=1 Tax=Candidatus Ryanbacteria bacterium RIFCSPHIGHO2_01_FULL_48_27 TaxID=1802115 RepID=A0A1G2G1M0_9BACT|nr:MAG: hypothetical protein A2756_00115 [Candidatus Ryanbacteria bacterium RIFCSPHIGHO2_01_FULL_48_27]
MLLIFIGFIIAFYLGMVVEHRFGCRRRWRLGDGPAPKEVRNALEALVKARADESKLPHKQGDES